MTKKGTLIAAVVIGAIAVGGTITGVAVANGGDDSEPAITGDAYDRASAAALDYVGEGHVTGTEVGDEDSYYEVEVTRDDGSQVDVQLDEDFTVVSSEADHEGGDGEDEGGADD